MAGLRKFEIQNFRGFTDFSMEDLGQVNLILGKNDTGKSSVLEGIFLLMRMSNPNMIPIMNSNRDLEEGLSINRVRLAFKHGNIKESITVQGELDDEERHLKVEYREGPFSDASLGGQGEAMMDEGAQVIHSFYSGKKTKKDSLKKLYQSSLKFGAIKDGSYSTSSPVQSSIDPHYSEKYICPMLTHRTILKYAISSYRELFVAREEGGITELLKSLDSRIVNVQLVDQEIMVEIEGTESKKYPLLPLGLMGDGMVKLFLMDVSMRKAENGILLIDEIDNGLHFSALKRLWREIFLGAKQFNVQIFATTHSLEALRTLKETLEEPEMEAFQETVRCITLERHSEENIKAYTRNFEEFQDEIDNENEIR